MLVGEVVVAEVVTGDVVEVLLIEVVALIVVVVVPPGTVVLVEVLPGTVVVLVDELLLIHWSRSSLHCPSAQGLGPFTHEPDWHVSTPLQ